MEPSAGAAGGRQPPRHGRRRQRAGPLAAAAASIAVAALLLAWGPGPVVVNAYPHYLLNPEGCKTKKLEVSG